MRLILTETKFISRGTNKAESPRCALFFVCFELHLLGWKVLWVIIVVTVVITVIFINAVVVAFGRATGKKT